MTDLSEKCKIHLASNCRYIYYTVMRQFATTLPVGLHLPIIMMHVPITDVDVVIDNSVSFEFTWATTEPCTASCPD